MKGILKVSFETLTVQESLLSSENNQGQEPSTQHPALHFSNPEALKFGVSILCHSWWRMERLSDFRVCGIQLHMICTQNVLSPCWMRVCKWVFWEVHPQKDMCFRMLTKSVSPRTTIIFSTHWNKESDQTETQKRTVCSIFCDNSKTSCVGCDSLSHPWHLAYPASASQRNKTEELIPFKGLGFLAATFSCGTYLSWQLGICWAVHVLLFSSHVLVLVYLPVLACLVRL